MVPVRVVRQFWLKLSQELDAVLQDIDLNELLLGIHSFFMGLGVDEIRRRGAEDDKPLRMVKTVLHELCKLKASPASCNLCGSFWEGLCVWPEANASKDRSIGIWPAKAAAVMRVLLKAMFCSPSSRKAQHVWGLVGDVCFLNGPIKSQPVLAEPVL